MFLAGRLLSAFFDIYSKTKTMKNLKRFLVVVSLFFFMIGCGPGKHLPQNQDNNLSYSMQILFEKNFTMYQFDSLCVADTLPINFEKKWIKNQSLYDYETNKPIEQYYYIKRLGQNESFYRLIIIDEETYNVFKRVVYGKKEE